MHKDVPILFLSHFRSASVKLSESDGWLLSLLPALAADAEREPCLFAQRLLDILKGHDGLNAVRRVCLARRLGCSNQLLVVSSAHADGGPVNSMQAGYSCFVDENGSLSAIPTGGVRVFASARGVVESFEFQGRPPQRSIARIAATGFVSGACTPVKIGDSTVGYVFLNWDSPIATEITDRYQLIMCHVGLCALAYLTSRAGLPSSHYAEISRKDGNLYVGRPWTAQTMVESIKRCATLLQNPQLQVEVAGDVGRTLVSHGNIAQLLTRSLEIMAGTPKAVSVQISRRGSYLQITAACASLNDQYEQDYRLLPLKNDARSVGYKLDIAAGGVELLIPYDGATTMDYSVECGDYRIVRAGVAALVFDAERARLG